MNSISSASRRPSLLPSRSPHRSVTLSRRQLLAGASAGAAALFFKPNGIQAQETSGQVVVFSHTTVVTGDANRMALSDVALAVKENTIVAIGPTEPILEKYPQAYQHPDQMLLEQDLLEFLFQIN